MKKKKEKLIKNLDDEIIFIDYPNNLVPEDILKDMIEYKNSINKKTMLELGEANRKLHREGKNVSSGRIENIWFDLHDKIKDELLTKMESKSFGSALREILTNIGMIERKQSLSNLIPDWVNTRLEYARKYPTSKKTKNFEKMLNWSSRFDELYRKNKGKRS